MRANFSLRSLLATVPAPRSPHLLPAMLGPTGRAHAQLTAVSGRPGLGPPNALPGHKCGQRANPARLRALQSGSHHGGYKTRSGLRIPAGNIYTFEFRREQRTPPPLPRSLAGALEMPDLGGSILTPPNEQSERQGDRKEGRDNASCEGATAPDCGLKEQVAYVEVGVRHAAGSPSPEPRGLARRCPARLGRRLAAGRVLETPPSGGLGGLRGAACRPLRGTGTGAGSLRISPGWLRVLESGN